MCGLVGIAGTLLYRDEQLMRRMMTFSGMQRGDDSAGLGVVRRTGNEMLIDKAVGPPQIELFERPRFKGLLSANSSKVFLGHTRKATYGEKTRFNAHPFEYDGDYGHIIGAHNGSVHRTDVVEVAEELEDYFTVDSQAIIAAIAEWGPKKALSRFVGAWSLVWYNKDDDTLNFLRNDERPMIIAWSEDRKTLLYASESWMIDVACSTVTPVMKLWRDKKGHAYFVHAPDTWYIYPLEKIMNPPKGDAVFKPTVRKVEGKKVAPFVMEREQGVDPFAVVPTDFDRDGIGFGGRERHAAWFAPIGNKRGNGRSLTTTARGNIERLDVITVHVKEPATRPYSPIIDRVKFDQLHGKDGCDFCGSTIPYGVAGIQIFLGGVDEKILCPNCSRSKATQIHVKKMTPEIVMAAKSSGE